jgi:hypothetical protein
LDGLTNQQIADTYQQLFKRNAKNSPGGPPKLDAQVMAVALATLVTKESLVGLQFDGSGSTNVDFVFADLDGDGVYDPSDGETAEISTDNVAIAGSFGFAVSAGGVGSMFFDVGENYEAFGLTAEDNHEQQIIDLLLATDSMSTNGVLYDLDGDDIDDDEEWLRILANDVYNAINEQGHI